MIRCCAAQIGTFHSLTRCELEIGKCLAIQIFIFWNGTFPTQSKIAQIFPLMNKRMDHEDLFTREKNQTIFTPLFCQEIGHVYRHQYDQSPEVPRLPIRPLCRFSRPHTLLPEVIGALFSNFIGLPKTDSPKDSLLVNLLSRLTAGKDNNVSPHHSDPPL